MPQRRQFDVDLKSVQWLTPPDAVARFEGVDFSPSGKTLGIATSDTNSVLLYRRRDDGRLDETPYCRIDANYPHDVSFARCGNVDLLAVAQRAGAIAIFAKSAGEVSYGPGPAFEIKGEDAQLEFSDGVAFVPPGWEYLAACNLTLATVSFYRRTSLSPLRYTLTPEFQLKHPSVVGPDGLAFSSCGKWLAVANHGGNSVSVFRRRNRFLARGKLAYGPEPVMVIDDPSLLYPHSWPLLPRRATWSSPMPEPITSTPMRPFAGA